MSGSLCEQRPDSKVYPVLMDIGEAMLKSGADVHTIEQTLLRLGFVYGAARMNVLVITAVIIVTVIYPDGSERTYSRRIVGEGGTDFAKLESLSRLCDECEKGTLTADEIQSRLDAIKRKPVPDVSLYLGGILSAGGFAVFFGGSVLDGIVSAVFAFLVCIAIKHFRPMTPNTIVFNFATSVVSGVLICFVAGFIHAINVNTVIIGVIMLLIPGVAMTNSTRDMLSGDTITGVMRFIESLLWATSLALGFMVAIWLASLAGITFGPESSSKVYAFWIMVLVVLVSSLGFALFFNVKPQHIAIATLGGLLTWMVFYFSSDAITGVFVPCLIASTFAAVYSEVLARHFRVPNSVFFIISVIPLVPGRGLYYTMQAAVQMNWTSFATNAITTLTYAAGIAVGICLIAAIMQTWDLVKQRYPKLL